MEKATIPVEIAIIPTEEARQCLIENAGNADINRKKNKQVKSLPSLVSEHLSQPCGLKHRDRLLWLQTRRNTGLWAQCDSCNRWRYLPNVADRYDLPSIWHCNMNPDTHLGDCSVPEVPIDLHDEEDLIHSRFNAGSVVWARMPGWPWWPAMVEDCPDTEQFYWLDGFTDIPTHYNVTFFDKSDVTRAWISNESIKSYKGTKNIGDWVLNMNKYAKRLKAAKKHADNALEMPLSTRLQKYSFLKRYKGNISTPRKIPKAELEKYRKLFKRKFHVEIPSDSSDAENDSPRNVDPKTNADSYPRTPKKARAKRIRPKKIINANNDTNFSCNITDDDTAKDKPLNAIVDINQLDNTSDKDTSIPVVPESLTSLIVEGNDTQSIFERAASTNSDNFDF